MTQTIFRALLALALATSWSPWLVGQDIDLTEYPAWQLVNVVTAGTEYRGKQAIQVLAAQSSGDAQREHLAILSGIEFENGTIELELSGKPRASAGGMARGFVGVAFRVRKDEPNNYEAFYLRPTNGRAEDQVRRNHSVQYISHPDHPWDKLRAEFPSLYESYADLVPGQWTKVKIVVNGLDARLYVGGAEQPCLIVKDLKHGQRSGAIALWIEPSTEAYFRDLKVSPLAPKL